MSDLLGIFLSETDEAKNVTQISKAKTITDSRGVLGVRKFDINALEG